MLQRQATPVRGGCPGSHISFYSQPANIWNWKEDTTTAGTRGVGGRGRGVSPQNPTQDGSTAMCQSVVSLQSVHGTVFAVCRGSVCVETQCV